MRPSRLKLGTHVDGGQMYRVYQNQAAAEYLSLYFFIFLSFQCSNKNFCHTFLRICEAYKVDTWYTRGQWVDVSCIPQSGCCFLFVPYFCLSNVQNFKIFVTLSQELWGLQSLNLVHLSTTCRCLVYSVYQNQAAAAYLSLYFFIFLSLQLSNINNFRHTFLRNCEA